MKIVDYYQQTSDFLTLVEKLGGCIENSGELKKRAESALHEEGYFYVECREGKIRLKGIDEIARVLTMPDRVFKRL